MEKFSNNSDEIRIKVVIFIDKVVDDIVISKKIEQSIYNYIIRLSKERNIQRRWNNIIFKKLYDSKVLSIYSNLKEDSYIGNVTFKERLKKGKINV